MDDRRFDALVRSLAAANTRRQVLKGVLGLSVGLGATTVARHTEAARRGYSGPQLPTPPAPCVPICDGTICGVQDGCGGTCVCGSGHYCSNGGCCEDTHLDTAGCFWMESASGHFCWVFTTNDYETCKGLDECSDEGGSCFKWSTSSTDPGSAPPWS